MTIIVAGCGRCGTSLTMAMLAAGGMDVGVGPPFFEKVKVDLRYVFREFSGHLDGLAPRWVPFLVRALTLGARRPRLDPALFVPGSCPVKILLPHMFVIPHGPHLAIWLDRNESDRCASLSRHIGRSSHDGVREFFERYFTVARRAGHEALSRAGAKILVVNYEDLTGMRRRMTVDRIVEFVGQPLDRDAMVRRVGEYIHAGNDRDHIADHLKGWRLLGRPAG